MLVPDYFIILIGGADSRACLEASAADATAEGLIAFGFAGCGLAGCEAVGSASTDGGVLGCWLVLPKARADIHSHPSIPKR
jgi:hypothetical protein